MRRFRTPRRLISTLASIGLTTGLLVALGPAGTAQANAGPAGGFVIPAGAVASLTHVEFAGGATNSLSWGYRLDGGANQVQTSNTPGTDAFGPDVTLGPFATDQTLLVFLNDNTCETTFYSDGSPVDHVTVQGSNPYSMDFFDAGGICETASVDRHEEGFNFHVDLAISCPPDAVPPDAPTNVQAFGGDQSAAVSWNAPANDGGAPIQSYTVNVTDQSTEAPATEAPATEAPASVQTISSSVQTTDASTSTKIDGLTNGDPYVFTVQATNCAGTGPASGQSNQVTPSPGTSAEVIGPGNLSQSTGAVPPTAGDTTVGVQKFPAGTTGIGTLEELPPGSAAPAVRGAASVDQFCAPSTCIGNVLQAELHNGSLGGAFYKIKLFLDSTLVTGPVTDFKVWYDGNLLDDNAGPDPTPPVILDRCTLPLTTPCISRLYFNKTLDLKIVVKSSDLDPRLTTSK